MPSLLRSMLALPLFVAVAVTAACERSAEPPAMVPEGTGKASSSAVQPEVAPVETGAPEPTAKPAEPAQRDPRTKDPK